MRTLLVLGMLLFMVLVGYLLLWPVEVDPVAWRAPKARPLVPGMELSSELLERVALPDGEGPEDVEVDSRGRVYLGLSDGRILRQQGDAFTTVADTGGRPLGLHWALDGRLLIADAMRGLLALDADGRLETLVSEVDGRPLVLTDDVDVAPDGTVYVSDASSRFRLPVWTMDVLESRPSGRLIAYEPSTGEARTVLDGLYFANGVAVDPEGRWLLVNETTRYRVRKLWLEGPRAGQDEVLIDHLPGFPDGISAGSDGVFWLALAAPRDPALDFSAPHPWLRRVMARLPRSLQPAPARTTRLLGITGSGEVAVSLHDPAGAKLAFVTSVQERAGRLYLGSLHDGAYAHMPRPH